MRRVEFNGPTSLMDYCSKPGYASGGFIADSKFSGPSVLNGSQQQFLVRNSTLDGWSNGLWNQVFSGDVGAPAQKFGSGGQYTTLAASPVTAEEPFLRVDSSGNYSVFVPASRTSRWDRPGPTARAGHEIGSNDSSGRPADPVPVINAALARGQDLILTPASTIWTRPSWSPGRTPWCSASASPPCPGERHRRDAGASVPGVELSGMIFDGRAGELPGAAAGRRTARARDGRPGRPHLVQDVFSGIGGAAAGRRRPA